MAIRKLKKGELLFSEGEPSKSMYFIQRGSIRLFKKKGNSPIELGMIHTGEVIGEMGFLDGGPRSASAEALQETDLLEITNDKMQEQLKVLQPWLIVLLKTVVNRLRASNTKVKQLETASTTYTYGRDGVSQVYAFLNPYEVMKISTAVLLAGSRSTEKNAEGLARVKLGAVQKFAHNVMGVHLSKIMEMVEILGQHNMLHIEKTNDGKSEKIDIFMKDAELLDGLITFINEENLKDQAKKLLLSVRAVHVMGLIEKYISEFPPDQNGICTVNMASIFAREKEAAGGKDPYIQDDFKELVKNKLATELAVVDAKNTTTKLLKEQFLKILKFQRVLKDLDNLNADKQKRAA